MRTQTKTILAFLVAVTAACASSDGDNGLPPAEEGHAYLTIVGDRDVFIEAGAVETVTVKYHDESGSPLAGEVTFRIDGNGAGSVLSDESGVTDAEGLVRVTLSATTTQAAFRIVAEATYATSVDWRVAVADQPPPLAPLTMSGTYEVDSQFDLVSGIPGTAGDVVNTIIDMTDSPNDPATWVLDQAMDAMDGGFIEDLLDAARPAVDAFLNDAILSYSPGFVTTFIDVGNDFGQVAKKFGLTSKLEIVQGGPDGQELTARHTVTGVVYTVDGVRYDYTMADLGLENIVTEGVQIVIESDNKVRISDHTLPVSYGTILLFALNNIIIPAIDPWSHSIEDLLIANVDCYNIGWDLSEYIGFGSPSLYESACQTGIAAAAAFITDQILAIDAQGAAFVIHGDAKPVDTNADRTIDKLQNGLWEGTMQMGSTASVLAKPDQKFVAGRPVP